MGDHREIVEDQISIQCDVSWRLNALFAPTKPTYAEARPMRPNGSHAQSLLL